MTCQKAIKRFEEGVYPEAFGKTGNCASGHGALIRMAPAAVSTQRVDETIRTLLLEIYFSLLSYRFHQASAVGVVLLAMSVRLLLLVERNALLRE